MKNFKITQQNATETIVAANNWIDAVEIFTEDVVPTGEISVEELSND